MHRIEDSQFGNPLNTIACRTSRRIPNPLAIAGRNDLPAFFGPKHLWRRLFLTGHIQSNPAPRKPVAHCCTELHRATTRDAERRESPLVIRRKFGAVSNSKTLASAHRHTSGHGDNDCQLKELHRVLRSRSQSLGAGWPGLCSVPSLPATPGRQSTVAVFGSCGKS